MNKDKLLFIGFSFLLVMVGMGIYFVLNGLVANKEGFKSVVKLHYLDEEVKEIRITNEEIEFSVTASVIGDYLDYDLNIINSNNNSLSCELYEVIDDSQVKIKSIVSDLNQIKIYNDSVESGEIGYGKKFKLVIKSKDYRNIILKLNK